MSVLFMLMKNLYQQLLNCQPPEKAMNSNQFLAPTLSYQEEIQTFIGTSLFSTNEVSHLDPASETQDYTIQRESSVRQQDQSGLEMKENSTQQKSSWPQHAFYFDIESPSFFENTQDHQEEEGNKKGKPSSQKHNFPKFFVQDIIATLGKSSNQQKNQSQLIQHYKKFVLSRLEKQKSIAYLKMVFIKGQEDATVKKQFISSNIKKKIYTEPQKVDIHLLKEYLRKLLVENLEKMVERAKGRKIKDENRLKEYLKFVINTMDDLGQGELRGKAKKTAEIRQGRYGQ